MNCVKCGAGPVKSHRQYLKQNDLLDSGGDHSNDHLQSIEWNNLLQSLECNDQLQSPDFGVE